jgi:cytoskeletal protein RodZ
MKPVGKQLQEARLAKNWTPELAARETKIKVDRLRDLEADDYSHFTSPTYARGFVRTYARALGLDEYKILRQLDNKLPDDDSANIVTDSGVAYLPETSLPPRAAHQDYTGLYIVMSLGAVVSLAIAFVLFRAYQVGEFSRLFANKEEVVATAPATGTNADITPSVSEPAPARALPADGSAPPPPVVEATNAVAETPAPAAPDTATNASPRALPVDSAATGEPATNAAPVADNSVPAPRALPVDSATPAPAPTNDTTDAPVAPRALPVNATALAAMPHDTQQAPVALPVTSAEPPVAPIATPDALNTNAPADVPPPPVATPSASSKFPNALHPSNTSPEMEASLPPVAPTSADSDKPLILTATQDSFVRVTNLDSADTDKPVYAAVLRSGQSVGFAGHKFSINVGVPYAVAIRLDGVNYGPHSDGSVPETFTVQSHLQ